MKKETQLNSTHHSDLIYADDFFPSDKGGPAATSADITDDRTSREGRKGIICIGGAHLDRKATCQETVRFETSNPVTISDMCGGVVRNISENLARLGLEVSLISCVGSDKEGEWVIQNTAKYGVETSQVKRADIHPTGSYTALINDTGGLVISMADMNIYEELTVPFVMEKWSYISKFKMAVLDTNLPENTLFYIIQRCRHEGIPVFVDPVSVSKSKKLLPLLEGIHSISPNKEEAEMLTGMKIETVSDCRKACEKLQNQGVKNVIITLGKDGVFGGSDGQFIHIPALPVKVVDVTGAGDAFNGGYLFGLVRQESFESACKLGLAAAALTLETNLSVHPHFTASKILSTMEEFAT